MYGTRFCPRTLRISDRKNAAWRCRPRSLCRLQLLATCSLTMYLLNGRLAAHRDMFINQLRAQTEVNTCFNPEISPCPYNRKKTCRGDIGMIWSIGVAEGRDPFKLNIRGPVQTGGDVSGSGDPVLFVADPFLVIRPDKWYIFSEALDNDCQKGYIAYHVSLDRGRTWFYGSAVLTEDWHLSFPTVYSDAGDFFMLTCATAGTQAPYVLWLYHTTDAFPTGWRKHTQILKNQTVGRPVDPVLFNHDNVWYLFLLDDGINKERLFFSSSFFGPYTEHVNSRKYTMRQSGRILQDPNGVLWAFHHTSRTVERWQIETLTPKAFKYGERHKLLGPLKAHWASTGMHTFNAVQLGSGSWVATVDGFWNDANFSISRCLAEGYRDCQTLTNVVDHKLN